MNREIGSILERKARIFNVQKYSIYDGPGIRTLLFFKGCPLRCKWCSNPEGLERKYQVMFSADLCINCGKCSSVCPVNIHGSQETALQEQLTGQQAEVHQINRGIACAGCRKCEAVCPKRALAIAGTDISISEALDRIQQDALFYLSSGGGVTLGGGEVSGQSEFAANLLMECKRMGMHTAIETCGYARLDALLMLAPFTDLFLYDLKHIDPEQHYAFTGVRNERILDNLTELIFRKYTVKVRMPLIRGVNDSADTISRTLEFLHAFRKYKNFQGIDLLPYHKLGVNKYKQLDMEYGFAEDGSLTKEQLDNIEKLIRRSDLQVNIIQH